MSEAFFAQAGSVLWQTPPKIIQAARETFGASDLDPCAGVGTSIGSRNFRLPVNNGLKDSWAVAGRDSTFFINHPFGTSWLRPSDGTIMSAKEFKTAKDAGTLVLTDWVRQTSADWAEKTAEEVADGRRGIWLSKSNVETPGMQRLLRLSVAVCHLKGRLGYIDPATGKVQGSPNFSSVLFCFGTGFDACNFRQAHRSLGTILEFVS